MGLSMRRIGQDTLLCVELTVSSRSVSSVSVQGRFRHSPSLLGYERGWDPTSIGVLPHRVTR